MHSVKLVLVATLLNICSVACIGSAVIENKCNIAIYVWSIANVPNSTLNDLIPYTGTFREAYRENPNGGGISLKIAAASDQAFITQFEYTYKPGNPNVNYDISNFDGYPLEHGGAYLSPSLQGCPDIICSPDSSICSEPDERFCDVSADLTLTLCPPQPTTVTVTEMTSKDGAITKTTIATIITAVPTITTTNAGLS